MNNGIRKAKHDDVPPLIDDNSKILLLGSMLSPRSAEQKFYYAHPQNRFWRVLCALLGCEYTESNAQRAHIALSHGIALWDVAASCDIVGAADSTIKNVVYNDLNELLCKYPNIRQVYTTGGKAYSMLKAYNKTARNALLSETVALPSTSPLNCKTTLDELISAYSVITKAL